MAYIAKLAHRLARLRAFDSAHAPSMVSLLLLAACAAGEPTGISTVSLPDLPDAPVVVSPRRMTLEGGQQVLFRAYESDLTTQVTSIEWTTTGGSIGADGSYSSSTTGDFRVVGKRTGNPHNAPDTSTVTVVPVQTTLTGVVVSPSGASVIGGQQQQYTAAGVMSDGSTVAIGVTWSATGGTIDAGGLFMAGNTAGTFQVVATHVTTGIADTVPVTVQAVQSIALTPTSTSLPTGGTQQYSATGTLADGSKVSLATVGYSASGGTISASGLYTAPLTAGSYTAKAQVAPGTGTGPSATTTIAVTSTSSGATSSGVSSADRPNEPAGYTRVAEHSFDHFPGNGQTTGTEYIVPGGTWQTFNLNANGSIVADATAPIGPNVYQLRYPAGMGGGAGPGPIVDANWLKATGTNGKGLRELYMSYWIKVGGIGGVTGMEMPGAGAKFLGYVSNSNTARENQTFYTMVSNGDVGPYIQASSKVNGIFGYCDYSPDYVTGEGQKTSGSSSDFTFGAWHQVEIVVKANTLDATGAPIRNGIFQEWIDGRQVINSTNIIIWNPNGPYYNDGTCVTSAYPYTLGLYQWHYDPIWGGSGPNKTRTDYLQLGHIYISGIFR